ncbi:MAG: hypothetical protein RIB86_04825 [Imperialibacter sp.]
MNTFFTPLFAGLFLFLGPGPTIQKDCEVLMETLALEYDGECKKGLAHGIGKALGSHTYEGSFKKGYPDGVGTYTWSNGNLYRGEFKNGLKDGKGELYIRKLGVPDSIVTGYWDKDKYIGEYVSSYTVGQKRNILRTRFVHMADTPNQVEILIQRNGLPIGVSQLQASADKSPMFESSQTIVAFTKVVYPLTNATINFYAPSAFNSYQLDCELNFEIYREGHWRIFIQI